MNFRNIFKGIAQSILDAAMPAIKFDLNTLIASKLRAALPPDEAAIAMAVISAAIDSWVIKL